MLNEKRAGRVLVLLALCVIFLILPESKTRTNESRVDEFEADWSVELDWVGTLIIQTQSSPAALKSNHTSPD